jgi:transposase
MGRVRTREPVREQGVFRWEMPDAALPPDHPARLLWQVLGTLDLSGFVRDAKAFEGSQGRDVLSARMLLTLWLYAISVGVGSAREIARRIHSDSAFQWIVGDQRVGHAKLSEFRVGHREVVDKVFTDVLGTLLHRRLLSLDLVAQDGTRVRASASAPSFRRAASLEQCREQAALHLKAVLAQADDPEATEVERAARVAAALDYQRRVDEAIATVKELQAQGKEEPRASTTDAEARVMKMADGGFRPAYNVQLATAGSPLGGPRTIVGVRVTNVGSDLSSVPPMLNDIERRTGRLPEILLADANHGDHASIRDAEARGVTALISVPKSRGGAKAGERAENDPPIAAWRARMQTDEAKQTYRARASLCELPNAHFKSRLGLGSLLVRGVNKVTCVVLLTALASNLLAHASALLAT